MGSADVHLRTGRPGRALHRRPVRRAPASGGEPGVPGTPCRGGVRDPGADP